MSFYQKTVKIAMAMLVIVFLWSCYQVMFWVPGQATATCSKLCELYDLPNSYTIGMLGTAGCYCYSEPRLSCDELTCTKNPWCNLNVEYVEGYTKVIITDAVCIGVDWSRENG